MEYSRKPISKSHPICAADGYAEIRLSIWEYEGGALQSEWIEARKHWAEPIHGEKLNSPR